LTTKSVNANGGCISYPAMGQHGLSLSDSSAISRLQPLLPAPPAPDHGIPNAIGEAIVT